MNASPTIHCGSCDARMRLSPELMSKLAGRTGKLACRVCGSELRLDFRGERVVVETVELRAAQQSAADWLRQPSSPPPAVEVEAPRPAAMTQGAPALEEEEEIDEIFRTLVPGPPSASTSTSLASAASMLGSTPAPRSFELVRDLRTQDEIEASQRDSDPFVESERAESLSPHVLDDDESALTHLGSSDDSSPFSASLREAEINAIYSSMTPSRRRLASVASKASVPPPLPASLVHVDDAVARLEDALDLALPAVPLLTSKKSEPSRPPRPWELAGLPAPSAPGPFERFGVSAAPPLPEVVSLTPDGRLVNASDRPAAAEGRRMPFKSLGLFALAGLALGALVAQPEVQSWIRPEPATAAPRTIVIDEPNVASAERPVDAAAVQAATPTEARVEASNANEPSAAAPSVTEPSTTAPSAEVTVASTEAKPTSAPSSAARARAKKTEKDSSDRAASARDEAEVATDETVVSDESAASDRATVPDAAASASTDAAAPASESTEAVLGEFNSAAAQLALQTATAHASSCRRQEDPSGTALVVITFAPSGRVTSATISGPPFVGTETGSCIASRFRGATVPAFQGDYVTVTKNVVIQ